MEVSYVSYVVLVPLFVKTIGGLGEGSNFLVVERTYCFLKKMEGCGHGWFADDFFFFFLRFVERTLVSGINSRFIFLEVTLVFFCGKRSRFLESISGFVEVIRSFVALLCVFFFYTLFAICGHDSRCCGDEYRYIIPGIRLLETVYQVHVFRKRLAVLGGKSDFRFLEENHCSL